MELTDVFTIGLWSLGFLLLAALLPCLLRVRSHRFAWTAEPFSESTQPLANPYQGFYHIIRYTLSDDVPSGETAIGADSYAHPLALLEINLKQFRTSAISENGLAQLNDILASWSRSPAHTRLILRFLYDWDGVAAAAEPESLTLVLTHMDQVSEIVNRYEASVYLMQGVFVGNWGEMHGSHFTDAKSIKTLALHLHEVIAPSIYLSVRMPAQWRMITGQSILPLPAGWAYTTTVCLGPLLIWAPTGTRQGRAYPTRPAKAQGRKSCPSRTACVNMCPTAEKWFSTPHTMCFPPLSSTSEPCMSPI